MKTQSKLKKVFKLNCSPMNCAICCSCSSSSREGNWEITSMCFLLFRLFSCIFFKIWKVENSSYLCIVKFLQVGMRRKWHFDLVDIGECSSQGGLSEEQERLGTSPIEEERRQFSANEERLILQLNKAGQPIGKLAGIWSRWLGSMARMPYMCPMDYVQWDLVPQQYKNQCWEATQVLDKTTQLLGFYA